MVERKKHLANVAFGGAWSEELLERDKLSKVMTVLSKAAEDCADRDVSDRDLMAVLEYVRIPGYPAGHSDNIRPPKPEYPATFGGRL